MAMSQRPLPTQSYCLLLSRVDHLESQSFGLEKTLDQVKADDYLHAELRNPKIKAYSEV
jgi:hypothetical protein